MANQLGGFAGGEHHQKLPHVVTVGQLGKEVGGGPAAEAVERIEGDSFGAGRHRPGPAAQLLPGEPEQLVEVAFPEALRGLRVPGLEGGDPNGNRPGRRHRRLA
jgi:hypothetical protein